MSDPLARYLAGQLTAEDEDALELALFEDVAWSCAAERVVEVCTMLRSMAARGPLVPVVTAAQLQALGHTVTQHHPKHGVIHTHIAQEAFVAAHLPVDASSGRLRVEFCRPDGVAYFCVQDAPFDPGSGKLIILCEGHVAKTTGSLLIRALNANNELVGQVRIENHP